MSDMQLVLRISTDGSGKTKAEIVGLKDEFGRVGNEIDKVGKKSRNTGSDLAKLATEAAKAWAAFSVGRSIIRGSIDSAREYQAAITGVAVAARYAGEDIQGTLNQVNALTRDGLLSTADAALALKNLLARGFSLQQSVELINRFKDSAAFGRQSSLSFGEAVVSATEGIKNENSILVDNAGVTKNVAVMWKEYAAAHQLQVNNLTLSQKREAEYQGILHETAGMLGNAKRAADGLMGSEARSAKASHDAAVAIGQALTPAVTAFNESTAWFVNNIGKPLIWSIQSIGIEAGQMATALGIVWDAMNHPIDTAKNLDAFMKRLKDTRTVADKMRADLAAQLAGDSGIQMPNIGADTGARRHDTVTNTDPTQKELDKTAKVVAAAQDRYAQLHLLAQQAFADDMQSEEIQFQAKLDKENQNFATLMETENLNRQQKLDAEAAHKQALEDLEVLHEQRIIQLKQAEADAIEQAEARKRAAMSDSARFSLAVQNMEISGTLKGLAKMTAGMAQHNRAAFELNKAAATGEVIVDGVVAVQKAAKAYPFPWNIPGIVFETARAAGNLQAVRSAKFGGGGSIPTSLGGSAGGVPSQQISNPTVPTAAPTQNDQTKQVTKLVQISLEDDGIYSGRSVRKIIDGINHEVGSNGVELITGTGTA